MLILYSFFIKSATLSSFCFVYSIKEIIYWHINKIKIGIDFVKMLKC